MAHQVLRTSASALALAFATPAIAQSTETPAPQTQPAPAPTTADQGLADVVVTAERRTVSLQNVPIAASVLSGAELAGRGIKNLNDIQQVAPSVAINSYNRSTFINIRGVGIALSAPTSSPGVAYYVDGVLVPHEQFIGQSFYDIAAIEVLRGPQGTLTGQNSTGGAVYVRTPQPRFGTYSASGDLTLGDYGVVRGIAAANLGFNDNVALHFAILHDDRESFTRNIGPSGSTPGNFHLDAQRINLALRTTDEKLTLNVRGEHFLQSTDNNAVKRRGDTVSTDPYVIEEDGISYLNQKGYRISGELRYAITSGVQFRALTSWQDGRTDDQTDGDRSATAAPRPPTSNTGRVSRAYTEYKTQISEINLLSTGSGPFQWVVGGFRLKEHAPFSNATDNTNVNTYVTPTSYQIGEVTNTSQSLFGQGNLFVTKKIELVAGARYSWDTQLFNRSIVLPVTYFLDRAQSQKLTGKLGINYHFDGGTLLYLTASEGYKAGGVNVSPGARPFAPEKNRVYELGLKTQLFDRHVRLNSALFRSIYSDIQFNSLFAGLPLLQNAATGKSWGIESELTARFGGLGVNVGGGYLDSFFSKNVCLNNTNNSVGTPGICPAGPNGTSDELVPSGRVLPYSPKLTMNAGVEYGVKLGGGLTLTPRLQWSHLSSQLATPFPSSLTEVPSRNIFDARLAVNFRDKYQIEGFVTNFTNRTYIAAQVQNSSSASGGYIYGAPRQVGVRLTAHFGD